jgi:hypothetical protein
LGAPEQVSGHKRLRLPLAIELGAPIRIMMNEKWMRIYPEIGKNAPFLPMERRIEPLGRHQGFTSIFLI